MQQADALPPPCSRVNKQIAREPGTSERAIKLHRSLIIHKTKADSFAELVKTAQKLADAVQATVYLS